MRLDVDSGVYITVLTVTGTALAAILGYLGTRRKTTGELTLSERASLSLDAAALRKELTDENAALNRRLDECEARGDRLRERVEFLEGEIDALRRTMRDAGLEPPQRRWWRPPEPPAR